MSLSIRRTPFQDCKVNGTGKFYSGALSWGGHHEGAVTMQRWADCWHISLAPYNAQNDKSTVYQRKRPTTDTYRADFSGWILHWWLASQIDAGSPGGYKRFRTRVDIRTGFAYPVLDENAQNTKKGLEQKILHQFGLLSYISSDQETHSTANNAQ